MTRNNRREVSRKGDYSELSINHLRSIHSLMVTEETSAKTVRCGKFEVHTVGICYRRNGGQASPGEVCPLSKSPFAASFCTQCREKI